MNELSNKNNEFVGMAGRYKEALLTWVCYCFVSALVDLDHFVCFITGVGTSGEPDCSIGCRLLYPYLFTVSSILGFIGVALGIGLFVFLVLRAFRPTTEA